MVELINQFDYVYFELINGQWSNRFFDQLLPYWRSKYFWAPLYMYILCYFSFNYPKHSRIIIIGLLLTIFVADQLSSSIIKPLVDRARPCQDFGIRKTINLLVNCGGGKSFISSHATNHFALVAYLYTIIPEKKYIGLLLGVFWAGSISFAQIYVGLHFPTDVIAGGITGGLIGVSIALLVREKFALRVLY